MWKSVLVFGFTSFSNLSKFFRVTTSLYAVKRSSMIIRVSLKCKTRVQPRAGLNKKRTVLLTEPQCTCAVYSRMWLNLHLKKENVLLSNTIKMFGSCVRSTCTYETPKRKEEKKQSQTPPLSPTFPRFSPVLMRAVISVCGIQSLGKIEEKKNWFGYLKWFLIFSWENCLCKR